MIKYVNSYRKIPEGHYVFGIYEVHYDQEYGEVKLKVVNNAGYVKQLRYQLLDSNGEVNEIQASTLSRVAQNALNDFESEEFDEQQLPGKYFEADVKWSQGKGKNANRTFDNIYPTDPADGFPDDCADRAKKLMASVAPVETAADDETFVPDSESLDDLLG